MRASPLSALRGVLWVFEGLPGDAVVLFSVGFEKGGSVFYGALRWATWQGVVLVGFGDGAFLQVLDVFPAEGDALFLPVGGVYGVVGAFVEFGLFGFSGEADADQAFAWGEDGAAGLVVVGFGFVLAHDRKLDAVDGEQLFQREAEGLGDEDVDFYQRLAAGVVGAQGVVALPFRCEIGEEVLGQCLYSGVGALLLRARQGGVGV